ncbi:hypothetical protein EDD17DRAFT_1509720 [Pisolithus thermaeus]|nr:hypothetical protein EDD17DRAFT_1509720 [Pisolithus thermaeus]
MENGVTTHQYIFLNCTYCWEDLVVRLACHLIGGIFCPRLASSLGRVKAKKLYGNQVCGRFQCPPAVELRGREWKWEGIAGDYKPVADSKGLGSQQDNRDREANFKILLDPDGRPLTSFGSDK